MIETSPKDNVKILFVSGAGEAAGRRLLALFEGPFDPERRDEADRLAEAYPELRQACWLFDCAGRWRVEPLCSGTLLGPDPREWARWAAQSEFEADRSRAQAASRRLAQLWISAEANAGAWFEICRRGARPFEALAACAEAGWEKAGAAAIFWCSELMMEHCRGRLSGAGIRRRAVEDLPKWSALLDAAHAEAFAAFAFARFALLCEDSGGSPDFFGACEAAAAMPAFSAERALESLTACAPFFADHQGHPLELRVLSPKAAAIAARIAGRGLGPRARLAALAACLRGNSEAGTEVRAEVRAAILRELLAGAEAGFRWPFGDPASAGPAVARAAGPWAEEAQLMAELGLAAAYGESGGRL